MKYYLLLISVIFITSCTNKTNKKKEPLTVGNGNDVKVTLNVENNKNIEKIEFSSNGNLITIDKKEIISNNRFVYNFENKGEGTFKTCIYKLNDTICSESYVEQGYEPKLKFEKDSLIFTDYIGLEYE